MKNKKEKSESIATETIMLDQARLCERVFFNLDDMRICCGSGRFWPEVMFYIKAKHT